MPRKKPINSFVELSTTFINPSVLRRDPSHYIIRAKGSIIGHPKEDEIAKKSTVVGTYKLLFIEVGLAHIANLCPVDVLVKDLKFLLPLFSTKPQEIFYFKKDIDIRPSGNLMLLSEFKIKNPIYEHESFKLDCLEEIVRSFGITEVIMIDISKVKIDMASLLKIGFTKIGNTSILIRDNAVYHFENQNSKLIVTEI